MLQLATPYTDPEPSTGLKLSCSWSIDIGTILWTRELPKFPRLE